MAALTIERLRGDAIGPHLEALATLRIAVFREFPYLYEGSLDHERSYLRGFATSPDSTLVLARDGAAVVGASTALPLADHSDADALAPPLTAAGFDVAEIYYFGESVLAAPYRGQGAGHAFFDHREDAARAAGFRLAAFCAVDRPADHPARPHGYQPHDPFWTRRGYLQRRDIVATFSWRDVGAEAPTNKPMVFWTKELGG